MQQIASTICSSCVFYPLQSVVHYSLGMLTHLACTQASAACTLVSTCTKVPVHSAAQPTELSNVAILHYEPCSELRHAKRCYRPACCLQQRTSHCYRIAYRSMERSLTDEEINSLQDKTRTVLAEEMGVELR